MTAPDNSREERKQLLRDWMTAQSQLAKVNYPNVTLGELATFWRTLGLNMTEEWVQRALYGHKSKIPRGLK